MKVLWSPRARLDLRELILYIAEDSIQAADLVNTRILNSSSVLSTFTRGGRPGRVKGTREKIVHKTPYILVYRVTRAHIRILRVFHTSRKWPQAF